MATKSFTLLTCARFVGLGQGELCHIGGSSFGLQTVFVAFNIFILFVPLPLSKVDEVEEHVLCSRLVNGHDTSSPIMKQRRGFPPRFQELGSEHCKLWEREQPGMVGDNCLTGDVQGFTNVTLVVRHEDEPCTDTCSQLLLTAFPGPAEVRRKAICQIFQKLTAVRCNLGSGTIEEVKWISFDSILN